MKSQKQQAERAILMGRVSTGAQLDNTSPEAQLEQGQGHADKNGYVVADRVIESISGAFVLARSKFLDVLERCQNGEASVIVYDVRDRLGRGDAPANLEFLAKQHGARIEYARAGYDTSTAEGFARKQVDDLVSGMERINIGRRTRDGKYDRAREGRVIATNRRPYGYEFVSERDALGRKTSCRLQIIEREAEIVRRIYGLLADDGMTMRSIAVTLNREGIPSPTGKTWERSTVHRIATSETYRGIWRFGKVEQKRLDGNRKIRYEQRKRTADDTIAVPCPAIVDAEMWQAAQAQIAANSAKFVKPTKHTYLLRGRVVCAKCGRAMCGRFDRIKTGGGHTYYSCTGNAMTVKQCNAKSVRADQVEGYAWRAIVEAFREPEQVIAEARARQADAVKARRNIEALIEQAEKQNVEVERRIAKLVDGWERGLIEDDELEQRRAQARAEIAKRNEQVQTYRERLAEVPLVTASEIDEFVRLSREAGEKINEHTPQEARARFFEVFDILATVDSTTGDVTISGVIGERTMSTLSRTSSCTLRSACRRCVFR